MPVQKPEISIIIPCFNEADRITTTLNYLKSLQGAFEIIVVDGNSNDQTINQLLDISDVQVLKSNLTNRAFQMNLGANSAEGNVFLFLHADTLPPIDFYQQIKTALLNPSVKAGAFTISFDHAHWVLSTIEALSRIKRTLVLGDHGIFVRRNTFLEMGGYRAMPILEDLDLQTRLRKKNPFVKIQKPVITSARKFVKNGIVKQTFVNLLILAGFYLGVRPERLVHWYRS